MTTLELYCPTCKKVTRHHVLPDDRIVLPGGLRIWTLSCGCGTVYKCTAGMKYDDSVKSKLLGARESCKMFWTDEERKLCPEEQTKAEIAKLHDKHKIGDKEIERLVRDAIVGYMLAYPKAPNDDCERELKERAEIGNQWLKERGLDPEDVVFDKEEVPCC